MEGNIVTVYFSGEWKMVDSVWQFDGELCKAVLINASIEFDELKKIIHDRFQVNPMTHDIRLTHSNTTPSLKPFDLSSTPDLQTFFSINKMAPIAWSMPLCVSLVKKLNENLTESGVSGSAPTNIIEVDNRDVTEPELQGDSMDCNAEVMDIESHEQPRARLVKKNLTESGGSGSVPTKIIKVDNRNVSEPDLQGDSMDCNEEVMDIESHEQPRARLVKKLNKNLTKSGGSGSAPTKIIEVDNRDGTEPELQDDSRDCNEEVMDIESHEQPRARLVKKLNKNLTESGGSGSVPTKIIEVDTRDVTEPELQDDSRDCDEEVTDIESHEQPRAPPNRLIEVGQSFKSKEELKTTLSLHAIEENFDFRIKRSTKTLLLARCTEKECKWRLRALKLESSGLFFISKYIKKHSCALEMRRAHQRHETYQVIAERIKAMHQGADGEITPKEIANIMKTEYNITASYWKCWRAHVAAQGKPRKQHKKAGRPKKVKVAPVAPVVKFSQYTCSYCGMVGHTKRSCTECSPIKRKCSICGVQGHSKNSCINQPSSSIQKCSICRVEGHNKKTCTNEPSSSAL